MCLLDAVTAFEPSTIVCRASSHRRPDNPLREGDRLSVQAGIEYAAQAVAVHGSLLASQAGGPPSPRQGMIAVLTDVSWQTDRLDTLEADLDIAAEKLGDLQQGLHYRFRLASAGRELLSDPKVRSAYLGEELLAA